jgi:hypothetical protein
MELFIPSLVVIILGGIVVFFLLPKVAPYTLGVMAVLLFGAGIYQHYQTFPYEYSSGNFRDTMKDYAPFLMLLATILGLVIGVMVAFGGNPPSIAAAMPAMPNISAMPVSLPSLNMGANVFGGGGNSTAKNNSKNNGMGANGGGNVKRNNVASTSFKVT